ncbi:YcxB family protein [Dyadobacter luteus]|jgi:magnesium-transporting ATPase (P-type)|uniref:YcxB family protein n=1 Tax=Dyadobacter luteus TaxID=2259619 RepID=A0A3D8YDS2_9BACT|nr:YcxB family protein [Dyadobacter luteus]REA62663.1 YcxB family protein [Dyadobacter luteus]
MAKVSVNKHQPVYQMPTNPAAVRTKKYALPTKKYITLAMRYFFKTQIKWVLVPVALILINAILGITGVYPNYWVYITVFVGTLLYILFWVIQFTGITQLAQYKPMFEKFSYEFDSRQILMKLNHKEGNIMKWEQILEGYKDKDAYVLVISKGQFVHLPFSIFTSEHDIKVFERILKQKELLKAEK